MDIDLSAQKLLSCRKCPACGANLMPPYDNTEGKEIKGDEICSHCRQSIIWAQHYIALLKDELSKEDK
jgi:hypothetical protein